MPRAGFQRSTELQIEILVDLDNMIKTLGGFNFALFLDEEPKSLFFIFLGCRKGPLQCWGVGRVLYNVDNTSGFSNVAQEDFQVGSPF